MGCSNCKEKRDIKKTIYETTGDTEKGVLIFILVWSAFAIYGIFSFVNLFL